VSSGRPLHGWGFYVPVPPFDGHPPEDSNPHELGWSQSRFHYVREVWAVSARPRRCKAPARTLPNPVRLRGVEPRLGG
jgi:hypothetical protein